MLARSLGVVSLALAARSQSACHDLRPLDGIVQEALVTLPTPGACLRVEQRGAVVHERAYGTFQLGSVVPIASASKWLSAAVLMALVDDGRVRLDDRVSTYVASFQRPDKFNITLRQCFSHASGLPVNDAAIADNSLTLAQAVDLIAALPMVATPGTEFSYGGVSMHVAGRVCEVVGGRSWAALFVDKLVTPLGLTATDYFAFGFTQNPRIAGGARSTVIDYARFVDMLRAHGTFQGRRVLSARAIAEMFRDQVDLEREVSGTLAVVDRGSEVWPYAERLHAVTFEALKPIGIACVGASSPACAPPSYLNGDRVPFAGSSAFALRVAEVPFGGPGALALGFSVDPLGTNVLGVTLHLGLTPTPVVLPWTADSTGRARMPLSLAGVAPSARIAAQAFWLDVGGCGAGLRAGHAIDLVIQAP